MAFVLVSALILIAAFIGGQFGFPGGHTLEFPRLSQWLGVDLSLYSGWFILLFVALFLLSLASVLLFPRKMSFRSKAAVILILSLSARLLLLPHPASDDVNRYLWEGRILAHGHSPYSHAPVSDDDPELDIFRNPDDPLWTGINHPEMTAIYPPLMLGFLASVASLSYSTKAVKLAFIGFDLATIFLLILILREKQLNIRWACLYALNPVVLFAFAGEGHLDSAQVFFLVLAIFLHLKGKHSLMWVALGLAVQAKYIAVLGWPFFLDRQNWKSLWIAVLIAVGPIAVLLPFDGGAIFESFFAFGLDMTFNGPIQSALRSLFGSIRPAAITCQISFLVVFGLGLYRFFHSSVRPDPIRGLFFAFGTFLLFSPTVHFWYLSWIIPLLVVRPKVSWLLLTATIAFTFVTSGTLIHTGTWSYPWWGPWAVWTLPICLMLFEFRFVLPRRKAEKAARFRQDTAETLTVIVPTFNEEKRIRTCLEAIKNSPKVTEIIVVDGGSTDQTQELASELGAKVIEHSLPFDQGGGRGGQLKAGVLEARSDVIAIVHADTVVPENTFDHMMNVLDKNPDIVGGAVGAKFDGKGATLRLLEMANDFRAAALGISFGDQVQFFRRGPVGSADCFPDIPLMEDVELSLRMGMLGRTCFLWGNCQVSPRHWKRSQAIMRVLLILRLNAEYLLKRIFGQPDTIGMYRRYYKSG